MAPMTPLVTAWVDGRAWHAPEGWELDAHVAACRSCAAPIVWARTPAGKRAPVNADGTSHFATCPQAEAWRSPRAPAS